MQAGTYLMLSAFVSVDARYDVDSVGIRKLIGWDTTVLKTSAAVHKLPDNRCDDFYVRFNVRFQALSPSIQRKPEVSLRQIAIAVGGASFGYILLGLLFLRILQQMYMRLFCCAISRLTFHLSGYSVNKYIETSSDAQKVTFS
jgi:hypothetical protein